MEKQKQIDQAAGGLAAQLVPSYANGKELFCVFPAGAYGINLGPKLQLHKEASIVGNSSSSSAPAFPSLN